MLRRAMLRRPTLPRLARTSKGLPAGKFCGEAGKFLISGQIVATSAPVPLVRNAPSPVKAGEGAFKFSHKSTVSSDMKFTLILSALLATAALSYGADEPKKGPDAEAVFKKLDTNGDGKLSLEEYKAGAKDPSRLKPSSRRWIRTATVP